MQAAPIMSLRDLGLEHPWILTHPIFWTAQHLDLLQCHFQDDDAGDATQGEDQRELEDGLQDAGKSDELSAQVAEIFAKSLSLRHKTCALINLLGYDGSILQTARELPVFFFANRPIDKPDCTVFHVVKHCIVEQHQDALPVIGYFHYESIISKRQEKLTPRPHPYGGYNGPVRPLCQRKLSKVTPQKWSQDPYLVCILLSMAQSLAHKSHSPQPTVFVVCPLLWLLASERCSPAQGASPRHDQIRFGIYSPFRG
ncbi:hypothetical protein FALCPG4_012569 [Fusarium falciforme]